MLLKSGLFLFIYLSIFRYSNSSLPPKPQEIICLNQVSSVLNSCVYSEALKKSILYIPFLSFRSDQIRSDQSIPVRQYLRFITFDVRNPVVLVYPVVRRSSAFRRHFELRLMCVRITLVQSRSTGCNCCRKQGNIWVRRRDEICSCFRSGFYRWAVDSVLPFWVLLHC